MTIPSDPAAARAAFPWIAFEGRWGELQDAFFNGPTGPNQKMSWSEPIEGSLNWRTRSYAVPTGGVFGTRGDGHVLRGGRPGLARPRPAAAHARCSSCCSSPPSSA